MVYQKRMTVQYVGHYQGRHGRKMPILPDVQVLTNNIIVYSWWIHRNTNTIETMYRIHTPEYLEYNASQLHKDISSGGQTVQ